jgi:hypothetical protein
MLHFSEALKMQATALINKYLSGREALIVTSRFLSGLSWPEIAKKLENPLCDKQLRRICRAALEKIILPENALWLHRRSNAP